MRDKQEVEIVDFLLQVKDCVVSNSPTSAAIWVAIFPFFSPLFCCPITFSFLPQLLYIYLPFFLFLLSVSPSPPSSSSQELPSSTPQSLPKHSTLCSLRSKPSFPDCPRTFSHVLNPCSLPHHKNFNPQWLFYYTTLCLLFIQD